MRAVLDSTAIQASFQWHQTRNPTRYLTSFRHDCGNWCLRRSSSYWRFNYTHAIDEDTNPSSISELSHGASSRETFVLTAKPTDLHIPMLVRGPETGFRRGAPSPHCTLECLPLSREYSSYPHNTKELQRNSSETLVDNEGLHISDIDH